MPRHEERRLLPFTPRQMYDLVLDVSAYPEFLPWCVAARVYGEKEGQFDAEMVIGFKMFRERFSSRVTYRPPGTGPGQIGEVRVDYIRGPMKYLHNDWRFEAVEEGRATAIHFQVDFEFKSRVLEKLIGALFEEAVHRMVMAFEKRAHRLYK